MLKFNFIKIILISLLIFIFNGCSTSPEQEARMQNTKNDRQKIFLKQMRDARENVNKLSTKGIDIVSINRTLWSGGLNKIEAANTCGQKGKFYHYFPFTTELEDLRNNTKHYQKILVVYCSAEKLIIDPVYGNNPITTDTGYWYSQENNSLKLTNYNQSTAQSLNNNQVKSVEDNKNMLVNIKNTCMEFGYKEGTETLANCMKDLYLKQTQSQSQSTTIITAEPKRKIDPSVWDDLLNISKGMSEGKSLTESLGGVSNSSSSSSKIQCFKTSERVSGTNKICSYNCMGSEVTTNVASTRICPMSIDMN